MKNRAKRFHKVNIEITNICNLQCSFCPEVIRAKKMMPLELFREIIVQVAPLTEQVCFHLMGEPLAHPELEKFVDICHEYQVRIFLVSNGILLREKSADLLLHPAFRQINFSLHSFFDNFPDKDPSSYLERIFVFTEKAMKQRPDLYINFRLWNLSDQKSPSEKNAELLKQIELRFGVKTDSKPNLKYEKSQHLVNKLYLHFESEFIWPSLDLPILGSSGTCYGLSSHFGILVDGTVVPCCLDKESSISLGNINKSSILEILNNDRAKAILQGFQQNKLIEELCKRCQYIERFK